MSMSHAAHRSVLEDAADEEANELRAEITRLKFEKRALLRSLQAFADKGIWLKQSRDAALALAELRHHEQDELKEENARLVRRIHRMEAQ